MPALERFQSGRTVRIAQNTDTRRYLEEEAVGVLRAYFDYDELEFTLISANHLPVGH
jgi:hypothetical protein